MSLTTKPVLTVDIVNFSTRSVREQTELIQVFIRMLHVAIPAEQNHPNARIWSPAGDGGAITFWDSLTAPIETAIEIGRCVQRYNQGEFVDLKDTKFPKPQTLLQVRIGIHLGTVSKEVDFDDRINIWGDGINTSARIVGLTQPGQILVSEEYYKAAELADMKQLKVSRIGKGWAKHNKSIELYNVQAGDVGLSLLETDEWFGPLHYPLQQAIKTYKGILAEEYLHGKPFRVGVIAKRVLDLDPRKPSKIEIESQEYTIEEVLSFISERSFRTRVGHRTLFDPFFSKLSPEALLHFFRSAYFDVFERGEIIVSEGEPAQTMMIVVSGEVGVYRNGAKLRVIDIQTDAEVSIVFREGEIVGEMGLFNVSEKRSATLKAEKNVMVLTLRYEFLRDLPGAQRNDENARRAEIRRQVWHYYCSRTTDSQLNYHPLLNTLSKTAKVKLLSSATFLPNEYQAAITLSEQHLWEALTIVVSGAMRVQTRFQNAWLDYAQGDCIGPVRLVMEQSPYTGVEIPPDTQLVTIPWRVVEELLDDADLHSFYEACVLAGSRERRRMGVK